VIDTRDEVAEDVGAYHAVHLEDELHGDRDHREEGHRVDQVGLPEAQEEARRVPARDHLAQRAPHEEQRQHDRAAQRQVRPEREPPEPRPRTPLADEQDVAAHEERDQDRVDHALHGLAQRDPAGQEVEDGGDDDGDEGDRQELATADPRAGASHGGIA